MKIKRIVYLIFLFFIFINISGCSESEQIHQKLVVQGIGIDFESNKYIVTVQALDFKNPIDEDEPNTKTLQVTGITLMEALENISKQTSLTPVYSQNMVVVLGQKVAEVGIDNFIDFFIRHCEARPKVKICITKDKALEIFNIKTNNKPLKAKDICDLIPDELGSDILHFVSDIKNEISSPYVAWISPNKEQSEGKNICLKGVAVFAGDKLSNFIDEENAYGFMILKGVPNFGAYTIKVDKFGDVTCIVSKVSGNTKVQFNDDIPCFDINLNMDISVFAMDKKYEFYFDEDTKNLIAQKFSYEMQNVYRRVIDMLKSRGEDVFLWGKILKNSDPAYFKKVERDWKEYIKKCDYKVTQNINISVTGKEPV